MQQQVQIAGMAWFEEDDYESFRRVLTDRQWHATFAEWEAAAKQGFERIENQGIRAIKAKARSVDFVAWCNTTGRDIDTQALLDFANEAAMREITGRDH
jgi:hypothetical protein